MITIDKLDYAKSKTVDHLQILATYLNDKSTDTLWDDIPDMLRQYADMIERDITIYKLVLELYQTQHSHV